MQAPKVCGIKPLSMNERTGMPECYASKPLNSSSFGMKVNEKRCGSYLFERAGFVDDFQACGKAGVLQSLT
jgi:hypothetical protein